MVLQNDKQAEISGTVRFFEADSTFGVVTPGSAKDGVEAAAIREVGKQAFDWHHVSIAYVFLYKQRGSFAPVAFGRRCMVWLRRACKIGGLGICWN